jgi:ATP-dependent DNA ligase
MLSRAQETLPAGEGWLYEPKWDGFRALVFRDGDSVHLESRNGQPLARYFPEVVENVRRALPERCVVDGEIVVPGERGLNFDALLQRVHPAESRVRRLAAETPALLVLFDVLALEGRDLMSAPFSERRLLLEDVLTPGHGVWLTAQTDDAREAQDWFERFEGAGLDGVVAKRADQVYRPGERVMVKVKHHRTADCVVGGYRLAKSGDGVGSLLLGLHDGTGVLHYVGHTSAFNVAEARDLLRRLRPLEGGRSFAQGRTPGGPSRWSRQRATEWVAIEPVLVCEVHFEQLQSGRFRHAARFLRWRPDKQPAACTFDQLDAPQPVDLEDVLETSGGRGEGTKFPA